VDPGKLTKPERALWQAFSRGDMVDLTRARGVSARTVRAEVISALLLGAVPPEPGRIAAIRLDGARVTGPLDLGHAVIPGPVRLQHCEFDAAIDLSGTRARDIHLDGSKLVGLVAPLAEIDGHLSIVECECIGQVVLTGARITGALRMGDSRLNNPGKGALLGNRLVIDDDMLAQRAIVDGELGLAAARVGGNILLAGATLRNDGATALNGTNLSVGSSLQAHSGFSAVGEINLLDASIGKELDFHGATLSNPGRIALCAWGVRTGSTLLFTKGFTAEGAIRLSRAVIDAEVFLDDAHLLNPDGDAIRCRNARVRTFVLGPGLITQGTVDFRHSHFDVIRDDPSCWPERLRLSGLRYDAFDPYLTAAERVRWLRRDVDGYLPQNYETLAAMYRRHGDDVSARMVLLARERQRREQLPWYRQAWSWLQEISVGYGYRPVRACAWLATFVGLGTLVFGLHHPPPFSGVAHPAFNPLIYTLDLLVPLVDLGMRNAYDPQGPERWLAYMLIAIGWILVTTIAAGIARVLRRQ
jgi:hypothetical protein